MRPTDKGTAETMGFFSLEVEKMKTAILVDGGFYRKRAARQWGHKTPEQRAKELYNYCMAHLNDGGDFEKRELYRIFYYDCPPLNKQVYHPLFQRTIDFGKSETYDWTLRFFEELKKKRKVALRYGELSESSAVFNLKSDTTKKLMNHQLVLEDLTESDFEFNVNQKGVDMRIGLDIASMAYKKQVDQIILIAGDSDFVPASKLARREGIDFILDPMWAPIKPSLHEHIDGLKSQWNKKK